MNNYKNLSDPFYFIASSGLDHLSLFSKVRQGEVLPIPVSSFLEPECYVWLCRINFEKPQLWPFWSSTQIPFIYLHSLHIITSSFKMS